MYFDARGRIDISYYLEGTGYVYRPGVEEDLDDLYETELKDAVTAALEYSGVYPDEVEQDYSNPEEFYFEIRNDGYSYTLEAFENFLKEMKLADDNLGNKEGFAEDLINSLELDEVIYNPELEKKKEEEEAEAKFRASKDAEYFASQEEREKQMKLALQERKFRIKIKKS